MSENEQLPELSEGARDVLSSYREASPASGRAKGNWAAIQASLAATAATATAATAAKAATSSASLIKWVLIGTAVLGAGGGAAVWAVRSNDDAADAADTAETEVAVEQGSRQGDGAEAGPMPAVEHEPEPEAPEPEAPEPEAPEPEAPEPAPEVEPGPDKPKTKPKGDAKPADPPPDPPPDPPAVSEADRLASEAELVASIQDAVVRKDWKDVERLSNRHAKEFKDGVMKIERKALQTVGRCESGDERGPKAAEAFLEKHGGSPHAAKVKKACGTSND